MEKPTPPAMARGSPIHARSAAQVLREELRRSGRRLTPVQNGFWVIPIGAGSVVAAPIAGWVVGRVNPTTVLRVGMMIQTCGLVAMALLLSSDAGYMPIGAAFLVYGVGSGLAFSQVNRVLLQDIDPRSAGVASGMSSATRQILSSAGVAVATAVLAAATTTYGFRTGIRATLLVTTAVLAAGSVLTWRIEPLEDGNGLDAVDDLRSLLDVDLETSGLHVTVTDDAI